MKAYALTICAACILVSVIEMLVPQRNVGKGIKMILSLYILLTVLSAIRSFDLTPLAWDTQEMAPPKYEEYTTSLYLQEAEKQLLNQINRIDPNATIKIQDTGQRVIVLFHSKYPAEVENQLRQLTADDVVIQYEEFTEDDE